MSDIIARESQKLEQTAVIVLFELDLRDIGEGILRFCPGAVDGQPIQFGGYQYYPAPVEAEGFDMTSTGSAPEPTLTMSIMNNQISQLIRSADDLVGKKVTRIITFRTFLDDGDTPDYSNGKLPPDVYYIDRKSRIDSREVEFTLGTSFDQRGYKIPGRQVIRDTCTHTYRRWDADNEVWNYEVATCPYVGAKMYDRAGRRVFDPNEDMCGKQLGDCELRFGKNNELPFYGFPGAGRL